MPEFDKPIRIAILGGGLAGAALFKGLTKYTHLKVDIFESAPIFREQGQAIGFNSNAVWALELLGLRDCLEKAGAVPMNTMRCMIGQGPQAREVSFEKDFQTHGRKLYIVQRAAFLNEILQGANPAQMYAGKKLKSLEQGEEITLLFEDGSTHVCDILIGADGIRSTTRKYVLGQDDPAIAPTFAGWWTVWTLVPFEKAQQHLGSDLMNPNDPKQVCWCGTSAWVMHDQLSNNTLTQCVITMRVPEDDVKDENEWKRTITKEGLQHLLEGWIPELSKGMVDLLTESQDAVPMYSMWHHRPTAHTYVKNNIAIMGDAADAPTPWKGSGGAMSMEDACLLSELLGRAQSVRDAKAALKAYEHVQKPRRQRLVEACYDTGLTVSGAIPEVGHDSQKIRERLESSWDWIIHVDLMKNRDDGIKVMQEIGAQ